MTVFTLKKAARLEETIKRSRFLALAEPVRTPEEAMAFIQTNSVPDATHNCWAYQIGDAYRFSDDGEPAGTAGRPILQAIQGQQCDQVVVLVIRWFGGVKLGTGGLVRAYGGCAAECLRRADKIEIIEELAVRCWCPFSEMALVQSRFTPLQVRVINEAFDAQGVQWELRMPEAVYDEFMEQFMNQTRGQGQYEVLQND